MTRVGVSVLGVLGVMLVGAGPAGAVIPTGNLLADQNPGAELGPSSSTGNDVFTPPGWTPVTGPNYSPRATTVRYGAAGGFPTVAQGTAIGGGKSFFAGGPSGTDDKGFADLVLQPITLPASVLSDVDAGNVQATLSACLGGYANQDDRVDAFDGFTDAGGTGTSTAAVYGPTASQRGGQTKLVPEVAAPKTLPAGTRRVGVELYFARSPNTAGGYNDGYADNISLRLSPAGDPSPGADCPHPAAAGAVVAVAATRRAPGAPTPRSAFRRVGKRLTLKGSNALVKLRCTLHDSNCKGTLGLAATGLPKAHKAAAAKSKATKLGSAKFTIAAGKTKTIKVRLKRSIRNRLGALSKRRLRKLKITATVKVGAESTKFTLGAVRKH